MAAQTATTPCKRGAATLGEDPDILDHTPVKIAGEHVLW